MQDEKVQQPPTLKSRERFTIRWDVLMGCYRVSIPEFKGPLEVVAASRYDALEAERDRYRKVLVELAEFDATPCHECGAAWLAREALNGGAE